MKSGEKLNVYFNLPRLATYYTCVSIILHVPFCHSSKYQHETDINIVNRLKTTN